MKNKVVLILFSAAFLLSACKKTESEKVNTKAENKSPEKFTIDSLKVNDSLKINDKLSVNYTSKVLVFPTLKDKVLLDSIYYDKTGITDYSKQGLQNFLDKDKTEFYASVKEDSKEWISDIQNPQTWEAGAFMKLISQNDDFLQIEYLHTSYQGGAHDNYSFDARVFDLKNNKKLNLKDITTMPKARLEELLMKNIDKIPSGTTDSDGPVKNSDMLLVDVIPANKDFYFDDKNLYFHYSPYEIAAFAAGDIVIPVSWKELDGTINPEFKKRMKIN
ncbi:RsiV family protein [Chryseobacterium balustinum]|uniref:RsiV family protein n=1 Tax=Chryseobacterium balustinum TaxID=246 RepID=UPI003CF77F17